MAVSQAGGFGTPTDDDRRPWLWVAMVVSCSYSVVTLFARTFSKWGQLHIEDALLAAAYVFAIVNWGLFDHSILEGIGSRSPKNIEAASEYFFASQVLLYPALYLSKASVLYFARRIFFTGAKGKQKYSAFDIAIGFTAACGIASIVLVSAKCNFRQILRNADSCPQLMERQTVIIVLDAVTEVIIIGLPAYFVSRVRMKPFKKFTVISLFGFRIFCIAFMAGQVLSYRPVVDKAGSQPAEATALGVWSQVVLGYSLISASIPCIRSFLMAFLADGVYRVYDTQFGSYGMSHPTALDSNRSKTQISSTRGMTPAVGPEVKGLPASEEEEEETASMASDASRRMMIERRVDFVVVREEADRTPNRI